MKRQRSSSTSGQKAKRPRYQRQDATVSAVVRKELRKKTDWKYTDHQASGNVSSSGTIVSVFSNLVRGDAGINEFSGNDIKPQALLIKYFMNTNQTFNTVRFLVFQWFDSVTPAVSGVLQTVSTSYATISPILVTNKRYIKVLYDKTHMMAPTAADGAGNVVGWGVIEPQTIYIPGKRLRPVRYNSSTNVVQDGQIYILAISDDSLTSYPQLFWHSRVTFSDD